MRSRSYREIILTAKFSQSTVSIMLRLLPCSEVEQTINYSTCTVKHLARHVLYVVPVYQNCMPHYSLDIRNTLAAANSNLQREKMSFKVWVHEYIFKLAHLTLHVLHCCRYRAPMTLSRQSLSSLSYSSPT